MEPTEIQKAIINHEGNTVVLASPGSGKTFVISEMIKRIIQKDEMRSYQGVIAISYTRKASSNLKSRTTSGDIQQKNSFFGTIDNFCLTQIIEYFGNFIFGRPSKRLEITSLKDLGEEGSEPYKWITSEHPDYINIQPAQLESIVSLFSQGRILVESLELLALHIIRNCQACRNYLKARFKYIFIDEFQDADTYTNDIFLDLVNMGLVGIAVGDDNQSIFGFAHKDNKYIRSLRDNPQFKSFTLNENFRCAPSIINYSNRLLDPNSEILETEDNSMFLIRVQGAEESIAEFINNKLNSICNKWNVTENCKVAILVKNIRTQTIIDEHLSIPHRIVKTTELDEDLNSRSRLFTYLLRYYFDDSMPFMSVVDEFVDYNTLTNHEKKCLYNAGQEVRSFDGNYEILPDTFKRIADILLPKVDDGSSISKLKTVLSNDDDLNSYKPMNANEVQLMTLHKSKGLEFDIVFHLNVCEWELPSKRIVNNDFHQQEYINMEQDLDLHYVGITRAKKACFLIRSLQRRNAKGELKLAEDSEFLTLEGIHTLRQEIDYANGEMRWHEM
ncbi:MAG: ATP-dependent helicase [Rikenellaceae bacterium]|nr:ATP-dependent helicase [Rikenellaceae bacterium]